MYVCTCICISYTYPYDINGHRNPLDRLKYGGKYEYHEQSARLLE